jgi:hypothetical protein
MRLMWMKRFSGCELVGGPFEPGASGDAWQGKMEKKGGAGLRLALRWAARLLDRGWSW